MSAQQLIHPFTFERIQHMQRKWGKESGSTEAAGNIPTFWIPPQDLWTVLDKQ
jgi:hypothetical protein